MPIIQVKTTLHSETHIIHVTRTQCWETHACHSGNNNLPLGNTHIMQVITTRLQETHIIQAVTSRHRKRAQHRSTNNNNSALGNAHIIQVITPH